MGASVEIRAPAEQSEGTRSQVLRWLKGVGEPVVQDEPLIELETDKVTVEIAAPGSGVLREILKHEQEEVTPGELLGRIEASAAQERPPATASAQERPGEARSGADARTGGARGRLSPAVRRLLSEHGLDAADVAGSGEGGRITVEDVMRHVAAATAKEGLAGAMDSGVSAPAGGRGSDAAAPAAAEPAAEEPAAAEPPAAARRVPHTPMRRRIAEHMVQSLLHTAPHVTTVFEADLGAVLAHREAHREAFRERGVPLTLTAYFLAACVDAIRAVPEANARWSDEALEIHEAIHIGVGTALGAGGLVVPVLRHVERRDLFGIASDLNALVTRAREGRLSPADVRGGTFTISNHGVSGSLIAAPIVINQPQSAILGIGKLEKRAVVIEENGTERIVVRPRCYVTLTLDHRAMDGFQANRFLETLVKRLASWSD